MKIKSRTREIRKIEREKKEIFFMCFSEIPFVVSVIQSVFYVSLFFNLLFIARLSSWNEMKQLGDGMSMKIFNFLLSCDVLQDVSFLMNYLIEFSSACCGFLE